MVFTPRSKGPTSSVLIFNPFSTTRSWPGCSSELWNALIEQNRQKAIARGRFSQALAGVMKTRLDHLEKEVMETSKKCIELGQGLQVGNGGVFWGNSIATYVVLEDSTDSVGTLRLSPCVFRLTWFVSVRPLMLTCERTTALRQPL
jgi:hypothetical protein